MTGIAAMELRWSGHGHVPKQGGVILAANHQSFLDPVIVACGIDRELHFMARRSLFDVPVLGPLIIALNTFPVERDSGDVKGVRTAIERLKKGAALLIFPEGTRTRDGRIGPMKSGIRIVAERAAVPTVPVLIDGAYPVWPKGRRLPRPYGRIHVVYGPPIAPGAATGDGVRAAILGLKRELYRKLGRTNVE